MKIKFPKIKKNYRKESLKVSPNIYWAIIVALFFVIVVGDFVFAYNLFNKTAQDETLLVLNQNSQVEREKKAEINRVLNYFSARAEKTSEIINSPALVVDPSL